MKQINMFEFIANQNEDIFRTRAYMNLSITSEWRIPRDIFVILRDTWEFNL
jgi:hypothetical protein